MARLVLPLALLLTTCLSWTPPPEYVVVPKGRFFSLLDGSPLFWQADTAWLLLTRLTFDEADHYFADRASKGFTVVLAVGFSQEGIDVTNRAGDLPFINEDVLVPNESYWSHVDDVVKLAWEKYGLRVAMVPAWGQYTHSSTDEPSYLNLTTSRPFGEFIGSRYPYLPKVLVADTNPYWTNKTAVKDDYLAEGVHAPYEYTDWSPQYNLLAAGITAGERRAIAAATASSSANMTANSSVTSPPDSRSWRPLMTIHPTNQWFEGGPIALASAFFGNSRWLTFDICQSGHADFPPNPPIPWWNARRGWEPVQLMWEEDQTRPVLDNEAHYEGRYDNGNDSLAYWNASDVRIGSWQAVLSGAAGLTYGADMVMQMYTPGLYDQPTSGVPMPWYEALHLPASSQMQVIQRAIMDRVSNTSSFFDRVPAQDVLVGDVGTDDQRLTASRDSKGAWILVYTPTVQVDTSSLSGDNVVASWYDPLDGTLTPILYSQSPGDSSSIRSFTPPKATDHVDWALLLEVG